MVRLYKYSVLMKGCFGRAVEGMQDLFHGGMFGWKDVKNESIQIPKLKKRIDLRTGKYISLKSDRRDDESLY